MVSQYLFLLQKISWICTSNHMVIREIRDKYPGKISKCERAKFMQKFTKLNIKLIVNLSVDSNCDAAFKN